MPRSRLVWYTVGMNDREHSIEDSPAHQPGTVPSGQGQPPTPEPIDTVELSNELSRKEPLLQVPDAGGPRPDGPTPVEAALGQPSPEPASKAGHPSRRIWLPVTLFVVTCLSTFWVGATHWEPDSFMASTLEMRRAVIRGWDQGLIYMLCVLGILMAHEMGHFVATLRYKIPASLPFFIPMPIMPIGTMGAVIAMDGRRADRKQIFDVGLAGPLAGLVLAVPILWIGVAQLDLSRPANGSLALDCPWLVAIFYDLLHSGGPELRPVATGQLNPYFMAGWVGLLITGLNMMPVSQLDGGHVLYTLLGKRAHWVARALLLGAIAFMVFFDSYKWSAMVILVALIGTDHPPTADDRVPLGWPRTILGCASLAIPVLCLPPWLVHISM